MMERPEIVEARKLSKLETRILEKRDSLVSELVANEKMLQEVREALEEITDE